jgi:hypothetical protein
MKKKIIREEIFTKQWDGEITGFLFSDLPKGLLPDDIIDLEKVEGYYSSNEISDPCSVLTVYREREETDLEFEKRKDEWNKEMNRIRDNRLKQYEELKKEFE